MQQIFTSFFIFSLFIVNFVYAEEGPAVTAYSSADPSGFDPQEFLANQKSGYGHNYASQVPGFGVVKETREFTLVKGKNELRFQDVAAFIDPTTVSVINLTDPQGTAVLEQNFQFDLVNSQKLLEKYIDREVEVKSNNNENEEIIKGILLSLAAGQLVLRTENGIRIVNSTNIKLGDLPGGLITKPTLVWLLNAQNSGKHSLRTTYQTDGITWRADYNLILNQEESSADLAAWVTLMNLSGASYKNAKLKLVAGDVERVKPRVPMYREKAYAMQASAVEDSSVGFEEKAFFEYHLYTLPRRTNIENNSIQQITLFPSANDVGVEKLLVYYGLSSPPYWWGDSPVLDRNLVSQTNKKVDVYIRFKNEKSNKLGVPLPAGKVRVFKEDTQDGTLEFIGENVISHTPKDEKLLIKIGQSFDIVGERTQTDFILDIDRKTLKESFKIELRNHKDKEEKVLIKENLYRWSSWEIINASDKHEKVDARTVHFLVTVPANGEKKLTYTAVYNW